MKLDWNPELYLKYNSKRLKPSNDLIKKINSLDAKSILDIGCGPGNSTNLLKQHFINSRIIGIDNSESMIKRAKNDYPELEWLIMDVNNLYFEHKFDIIFSNATIQWIKQQKTLFNSIFNLLNSNGVFACQIPLFWEMPVGNLLYQLTNSNKYKNLLSQINDELVIHSIEKYYDLLSVYFKKIDIWQTDYIHIMESHLDIYSMLESTGFRPYLSKFDDPKEKEQFIFDLQKGITQLYPKQNNGKVLFPFKRLFFITQN